MKYVHSLPMLIWHMIHLVMVLVMAGLVVRCGETDAYRTSYELKVDGGTAITKPKDFPDFFVRFFVEKPNGNMGRCSGTHLGYGVILTAAHCVISTDSNGVMTKVKLKIVEYKIKKENRYVLRKQKIAQDKYSIVVHPNYETLPTKGAGIGTFLFDYIALILTDLNKDHNYPIQGYGLLPMAEYIEENQIGGLVTIYGDGYPRRHAGSSTRYYGKVVLDQHKYTGIYPHNELLNDFLKLFSGLRYFRSNLSWEQQIIQNISPRLWERKLEGERANAVPTKLSLDVSRQAPQAGYLKGICQGDSGGGSIQAWGGKNLVIGVTSASVMDLECRHWARDHCCAKGELVYVRAYLNWISSHFENNGIPWPPHGEYQSATAATTTSTAVNQSTESDAASNASSGNSKSSSVWPGCSF